MTTPRPARSAPARSAPVRPLRVLHVATRREGGVKVICGIIEAGLAEAGVRNASATLIPPGATRFETAKATLRAAASILFGRYDAVFTYQTAASLMMGLLGSIARVPVRASHLTAMPEGVKGRWAEADIRMGAGGAYTHIIANSEATRAAFAAYPQAYRDRIVTIPHGVTPLPEQGLGKAFQEAFQDTSRDPSRDASPPVASMPAALLDPSVPLVVASGRLAAQKDYPTALRALERVPDAHLVIAGEGPEREALAALAARLGLADRLHMPGEMPREALHGLISRADAYLFPSVWETFGLAGAEASMAGVPVIASDLPVLREVLNPDGLDDGMVAFHPVGDHRALAALLRARLAAPVPQAHRLRSSRIVRARHAPAHMTARYLDLLDLRANGDAPAFAVPSLAEADRRA